MYKGESELEVAQTAKCNQPRLALRFVTIRISVPVRGRPVQRILP